MTPESILEATLQKTSNAERAAFLEEACGNDLALRQQIEALILAHEARGDFMQMPAAPNADMDDNTRSYTSSEPAAGYVIAGKYTLEQKLGEGGMGEVWVARQTEPIKRKVAIKLIKPGMDSRSVVQRFEQERQALAMMDHPNIARVLDCGADLPTPGKGQTTEGTGRPFFVMELVNGLALTRFCDSAKLTPRQRLELFVPICQAVQHAHHKGIVHRDLKPSNILVTMIDGKPVPKIIDFGVAKATGAKLTEETLSTQFGAVIGTLEYMAPEQAGFSGQDIDTRADLYSLGVILYELLSGLRPFDSQRLKKAALDEIIRILREEEPPSLASRLSTDESLASVAAVRGTEPRRLLALIKGELDWIVHKCLEKDRDRRYETANGLARDIQRYLADEPIEARPVSARYRLLKFYRRNRGAVLAASIVALSLLCGIIGTTWGLLKASAAQAEEAKQKTEAQQQTVKAEEQTRLAEAVNRFLIDDLLEQSIPDFQTGNTPRLGRNYPIGAIVDRAASQISGKFNKFPAVEAEIQFVIGQFYSQLADYVLAETHLTRALRLTQDLHGADSLKSVEIHSHLGAMYTNWGKYAQAEPHFEKATAIRTRLLGEEHYITARSMSNLASLRLRQGRLKEASTLHLNALAIRKRVLGESAGETINSISNVGWLLFDQGKPAEAAERFAEALTKSESRFGVDYPMTITARFNLATAYRQLNRLAEAESLARETLKLCKQVFGDRHPNTLYALNSLGQIRMQQSQLPDAEQLYRQTLDLRREVLGANHPETLVSVVNLANLLQIKGDHTTAEKMLTEAIVLLKHVLGDEHDYTATATNNLAYAKRQLGKPEEAKSLFLRALQNDERRRGMEHPSTVRTRRNLGEICVDLKQFSEAEEHLRQALAAQRKTLKPDDFDLAYTLFIFGCVLKEQEKLTEAEAILKECLIIGHTRAPNDWRPFNTRRHLGETLVKLKRYDEAEPILLKAHEGLSARIKTIPPAFRETRQQAGNWLIKLYEATGKKEQSEQWRKKLEADKAAQP